MEKKKTNKKVMTAFEKTKKKNEALLKKMTKAEKAKLANTCK